MGNTNPRHKVLKVVTLTSWGGAPQVVYDIIKGLDKEKFSVTLACGMGDGWQKMNDLGIEIISVPRLKRSISITNDLRVLLQLYFIMKKGKYDIVHCHSSKAGLLGRIAAKLAGVEKIYFTAHGWGFYNQEEYGWLQRLMIFLERIAAKCSTKIICVSESGKKDAVASGISEEEKFSVIKNGIDWNVDGDRDEIRKNWDLKMAQSCLEWSDVLHIRRIL